VLFGGVAAMMWTVNARKSAAKIAKARESAMVAYGKGDYVTALPFFSEYLTESKTAEKAPGTADVEALFAYGKSRLAIPLPKGEHLRQAKQIFERYLQLKPGDREAQHLLLELYPRMRYNEEALNLAAAVLEKDPKDVVALRARVTAYGNQRKSKEALAAAEELLKIQPDDLQTHFQVQGLTATMAKPGDDVGAKLVTRYEALLAAHPNNPRFELLLGLAHHYANNHDKARQWLKTAAARKSTDPEVAARLTPLLEMYNLFNESNAVLERLASAEDDPIHTRPLVRRLWQSGRPKDVLKRTDDQDPASPTSDTDLLAYRARALYDLNRPADATAIIDALATRKDDMSAVAWATALKAHENENLAPRESKKRKPEES
jgi:tetratricopeptide (TPR) repeat protein